VCRLIKKHEHGVTEEPDVPVRYAFPITLFGRQFSHSNQLLRYPDCIVCHHKAVLSKTVVMTSQRDKNLSEH
jgi:hypothetical protein